MKRFVFLFFVIMAYASSGKAQHLIVTTDFDTLNCKIGKLQDNQYPVTFMLDDEEINGLIHKDKIFYMERNVFRNYKDNRFRPWYPVLDLGIDGGVTHQTGTFQIFDDLTEKSDFSARTGFIAGVDLTYYVSKGIGYGLKYNYRSLLGGDVRYQYVGPTMVFRFWEKSKMNTFRFRNVNKTNHFFLCFSAGLGWIVQKNAPIQLDMIRPRIEMHAKTLAGEIAAGYHYRFSNKVSARIKASFNIGYPGFIKIMDIEKYVRPNARPLEIGDYCNNMNTINLSAGFTFHN